ncbi:D-tyrosyl-tRNA(Tyr) deacylase [bacterium]|nr:D-tyrosyl-tRNA(Tyr) deacylase [bacterium]
MRLVVQRVDNASVTIENELFSSIGQGYLILFGAEKGDTKAQADWLANKVSVLRCFSDENGKMNLSIKDIQGEMLIVSQFTLAGDVKKGTRPSFDKAMAPNEANEMYEYFISKIREQNIPVKTGVFGAHMEVKLLNNGPVTFVIDAPII